jgi:hypothetical protein
MIILGTYMFGDSLKEKALFVFLAMPYDNAILDMSKGRLKPTQMARLL